MKPFIEFSHIEKAFIQKRIKVAIDKLVSGWDVPMNLREKRIAQVVADAVMNLPTRPDKESPKHRRWYQMWKG